MKKPSDDDAFYNLFVSDRKPLLEEEYGNDEDVDEVEEDDYSDGDTE